jgi:uncharacterized protein
MWYWKMLQGSRMRVLTQALLVVLLIPFDSHALDCPKIPEQSRKDWEVEIKAAVGKIGPARGAELETATRTATKDLMGKLPQADKVYLEQMLYATYCSALRDDKMLSESEKGIRIRAYNLEVRKTLYGPPEKTPGKAGRDKEGSLPKDGPAAARIQLSQLSFPYTPEAFVESAKKGDIHAVKLFLAAGMDPNAKDGRGNTALLWAAAEGHVPIIDALLKAKANVNEKDRDGVTALSWAAARGNKDVVHLLLAKGADAEAVNRAFVGAAKNQHHEVLRILLARGADVKKVGFEAINFLVQQSSNVDNKKLSDTVGFLLDRGVDVNEKNKQGASALLLAARSGNRALVRTLLERGADVNAVCDCDGYFGVRNWTALQLALRVRHTEVVEALLAKGADVHHKNSEGSTALHVAAKETELRIVEALVAKGADVNAKNNEGKTPLMYATGLRDDTARALLDKGADVDAKDNDGWTALMYAASYTGVDLTGRFIVPGYADFENLIRALLERGADIDAKSVKGKTALIIAAARGNRGVVRALLGRGARVNDKDVDGMTALDYAEDISDDKRKAEIVRLLKQAGAI